MNEWGVRARVIMLALIPTALIAVVMGAYFIATRVYDLDVALKERSQAIASYLAQTAEYSVLSANSESLLRLVSSARDGDDDILAIAIYDKNNLLYAKSGTAHLIQQLATKSELLPQQVYTQEVKDGIISRAPIITQPILNNLQNGSPSSRPPPYPDQSRSTPPATAPRCNAAGGTPPRQIYQCGAHIASTSSCV